MTDIAPILMAEDEEPDVLLFRRALRKAGVGNPLVAVGNGREAMRYLNGDAPYTDRAVHPLPALLLVDLNMPMVDGFALLAWLQARPEFKDLPAVVLTSSDAPADRERARQLGAADYVLKPTHPSDLAGVVQRLHARWLDGKAEREEPRAKG